MWDGLRPDSPNPVDTPNLLALKRDGVWFNDHHSTYPTFTMMNAAAFATGAFPGSTGFYGNTFWAPGASGVDSGGANVDFDQPVYTEDYAILDHLNAFYGEHLLMVQSLFEAAQRQGLVTATVGKSGAAFLQDRNRGGYILDEKMVYPGSLAQELQGQGFALPKTTPYAYTAGSVSLAPSNGNPTAQADTRLSRFANGLTTGDPADAHGAKATAANRYMLHAYLDYVLPNKRPQLSVIWFRDPDTTEHAYGPGSANYHLALQEQDRRLGELRAKLRDLGMESDTNIIIVSDHAHSNVSGDTRLFPLRAIRDGVVGEVSGTGTSTSGDVRTAHLLHLGGLDHVYDGSGCATSALAGQRADGTFLYPLLTDTTGQCGGTPAKPVTYQTPDYRVPASLPADAVVIAANGGSDYLYVKNRSRATVERIVRLLQAREQYGAIFVASSYGAIPGTLPMNEVRTEKSQARSPDLIVSFAWNDKQVINGLPGTEYESFMNSRGMHGSFSPIDVHNTLIAFGPSFRQHFESMLPSANVDVAPTVATILGLALPQADGRVLREALAKAAAPAVSSADARVVRSTPARGLRFVLPTSVDGSGIDESLGQGIYEVELHTKVLRDGERTFTYFDYAKAERR